MNSYCIINYNDTRKYHKQILLFCLTIFFVLLLTHSYSEVNQPTCHNSKPSIAGLLPLEKTDVDVFLGEYGRETPNYIVTNPKTEPVGTRLSPKTISINSLFLTARSIRKKNPKITTSNFIFSPDTANHLRA